MATEHVGVSSESLEGKLRTEELKEEEIFARQLGFLEEKAPLVREWWRVCMCERQDQKSFCCYPPS